MCCKRYHIIFSTFSLKFKYKICFHKEVVHNYNNHILVSWPATNLIILRKWWGVWKTKSLLFCLRCEPLMVFWRQNHINDVTWPFSANGLFLWFTAFLFQPSFSVQCQKCLIVFNLWDMHFWCQFVWTSAKHRIIISPWSSLSDCGTHIHKRQYKIQWKGREPKQSNRKERVE